MAYQYKSGAEEGQEKKERSITISSAFNGAWNLVVAMVESGILSEEKVWEKHDEVYKQYLERFSKAQMIDGELLKQLYTPKEATTPVAATTTTAHPPDLVEAINKVLAGESLGVAEYEGLIEKYPGNASYLINEAKKKVRREASKLIPEVQY